MQSDVLKVIKAVSTPYGDDFFNDITLALNDIIEADHTFIAIFDNKSKVSKTIALVAKGQLVDNIEYSLIDTPCANVTDNSICYYPDNVCATFPKDQLLIEMKVEAYLGAPLFDSKQNVMGLLVALYEQPFENDEDVVTLFKIFSGRIAAELERREYKALLEEKVLSRTVELSTTVERLQQTQQQLVASEKMAAIGGLVAGIAHEVNTPLGIAITTHSIIADEHKTLSEKIANEHLSMKDMEHYRQAVDSALTMQGENLTRAKKIIDNFKKIAAEQHQLAIENINIKDYYIRIVSTLHSILKTQKTSLEITGDDNIILATYPGVHAQILTNLITNSVRHGFKDIENNHIVINIVQLADVIEVHYQDNGIGLSDEVQKHIFEPFFTSARKNGGIGLGMSIVYDLITQKLNGKIQLTASGSGTGFIYTFKASKT